MQMFWEDTELLRESCSRGSDMEIMVDSNIIQKLPMTLFSAKIVWNS